LFHEAVIVYLVGSGPGKGDAVNVTLGQEGMIDKPRTVIAVEAEKGKRDGGMDEWESL
jgi:hypothetical protein